MKALVLMHRGLAGLTVRLFDDANVDQAAARLGEQGFSSPDGLSWTRAVAGAPEATAWLVDVVGGAFSVDGGAGPLEAQLFEQIFTGFDLLATLNVERPDWYSKYLASVSVAVDAVEPALSVPVDPLPPV